MTADRASLHRACYCPPRQSFVEGARRDSCNSPTNPTRSVPEANLSELPANSFNLVPENGVPARLQHPSRNSVVKTARLSENKCLNSEIPFCYLRTAGQMETSHLQSGDCNPRPCPDGAPSSDPPGQAKAHHRTLGKPNHWTSKPMRRTWRRARMVAPAYPICLYKRFPRLGRRAVGECATMVLATRVFHVAPRDSNQCAGLLEGANRKYVRFDGVAPQRLLNVISPL